MLFVVTTGVSSHHYLRLQGFGVLLLIQPCLKNLSTDDKYKTNGKRNVSLVIIEDTNLNEKSLMEKHFLVGILNNGLFAPWVQQFPVDKSSIYHFKK